MVCRGEVHTACQALRCALRCCLRTGGPQGVISGGVTNFRKNLETSCCVTGLGRGVTGQRSSMKQSERKGLIVDELNLEEA